MDRDEKAEYDDDQLVPHYHLLTRRHGRQRPIVSREGPFRTISANWLPESNEFNHSTSKMFACFTTSEVAIPTFTNLTCVIDVEWISTRADQGELAEYDLEAEGYAREQSHFRGDPFPLKKEWCEQQSVMLETLTQNRGLYKWDSVKCLLWPL